MSTINRINLEVRVVDVDRQVLEAAAVTSPGMQAKRMGAGRFAFANLPPGRVQLHVEAAGLAPAVIDVEITAKNAARGTQYVDVVLGPAGLPAYRRKNVPVPFRSPEDKLGIITRDAEGAAAVERFAREHQLEYERPHGRDLAMITCSPAERSRVAAELRALPSVREVGRLVNPSARGTGLLTRTINVKTRPGTERSALEAVASAAGCVVERQLVLKDHWILKLSTGEEFSVLDAAHRARSESAHSQC